MSEAEEFVHSENRHLTAEEVIMRMLRALLHQREHERKGEDSCDAQSSSWIKR